MLGSSEKILETISGAELAEIVRDSGFSPQLDTDSQGDPVVRFKVEGFNCRVLFYGVKEGRSASLQFGAGFATDSKKTLEAINEWNRKKRFGKVYLDADGDPQIELDVDLFGGVRRQYLEELLGRWRAVFLGFVAFLRE